MNKSLRWITVASAAWLAAGFPGHAQVRAKVQNFTPVTDAMLQNPTPGNWVNWRRTLDGWGYSPLDQINRRTVADLRLVWSWALESGASQTTPLVYDGVMYVANPGNVVHALDARTGDLLWEYRRELPEQRRPQLRSLAIYQNLVIMNASDGHVVGLDAIRRGALGYTNRRQRGPIHVHERAHHRQRQDHHRHDGMQRL